MKYANRVFLAGLALLLAFAFAVWGTPTAPGATSATAAETPPGPSGRPAAVPSNYQPTPFGWMDPACVHGLRTGETVVHDDGADVVVSSATVADVARRNPARRVSVREVVATGAGHRIQPCGKPRFDKQGRVVTSQPRAADASPLPSGAEGQSLAASNSGWVAQANATAGAMRYLYAGWNVPAAPIENADQTLYFFPGLENLSGGPTVIMQPVLGWNHYGRHNGWEIASWNCCSIAGGGDAYHSDFLPVTGSMVSGEMTGDSCDSVTRSCATWTIDTYDLRTGLKSTLDTVSEGRPMDWSFGGVYEIWNLANCRQAINGRVTFQGLYLEDLNGIPSYPSWRTSAGTSGTPEQPPACKYTATAGSSTVSVGSSSF